MTAEFELSINAAEPPPGGSNVTVRYSKGMRMGAFSLAAVGDAAAAITAALQKVQPPREVMEEAGAALFDALFAGQVLEAYRECRTLAAEGQTGVRVRLFTELPDLAAVPWEYLFDHQNGRWLALDPDISLVRGLPLAGRNPLAVDGLLRVLAMAADVDSPGLPRLDVAQELENLDNATVAAAIELIPVEPTYEALQGALRRRRPHLFHFIGHGLFADVEAAGVAQGHLVFRASDGSPHLIGADRLVPLLAGCDSLRLVFLNACEGSHTDTGSVFAGLAQRLIRQQISAVLAMQAAIYDDHAVRFSQEFYRALADGVSVEQAVDAGRLRIHEVSYSWGIPTFYFQADEPFAVAPLSDEEKAERLWRKAQAAQTAARRRLLLEQVLAHNPAHAGAQNAQTQLEREEEATRRYAAAQAYVHNEQWREAHRTLQQIEGLVPHFRQTRTLLAEVLGRLGGQTPPPPADYDAQYGQYRPILSALQEGRLLPFLGCEVVRVGRPAQDRWVRGQYLPDTAEAAQELVQRLAGAAEGVLSLPQVSQYTSLLDGEPALYDRLSELYGGDYQPTMLHRLLAELPGRLQAKGYPSNPDRRYLIFSTAIDDLLERAFDDVGQPYHLFAYRHRYEDANGVAHPGRFVHAPPGGEAVEVLAPNEYDGHARDRHPVIVKLCGRVVSPEPDSVVVTEDQYLAYLPAQEIGALLPATLLREVNRRSFLFFGYSLQPWHLRLLWQRVRYQGRLLHDRSWAIVAEPTMIEREFWRSQNIAPIVAAPEGLVAYVNEWLDRLEARP